MKKISDKNAGGVDRARALAKHIESQLNLIQRLLRQQLNAEFAQGQLTGPQRLVMAAVIGTEGLSLKQLSAKVNLAHSTVSVIAGRLIKQGLLQRKTPSADRRISLFVASPAVRQFLSERMPELTLHPLAKALARASAAQRDQIVGAVDLLAQLLGRSTTTVVQESQP